MSTTMDAVPKCSHCGCLPHDGQCPRVKVIEYYEDGQVKRVEYNDAVPTHQARLSEIM